MGGALEPPRPLGGVVRFAASVRHTNSHRHTATAPNASAVTQITITATMKAV
jgi:hypothetical protein